MSPKNDIRSKYGMINEQPIEDKKEVISDRPQKDSDEIGTPRDKQKAYRIQGNILVLHGKEESDLQLTSDEKNAFTESVDEFRTDVPRVS